MREERLDALSARELLESHRVDLVELAPGGDWAARVHWRGKTSYLHSERKGPDPLGVMTWQQEGLLVRESCSDLWDFVVAEKSGPFEIRVWKYGERPPREDYQFKPRELPRVGPAPEDSKVLQERLKVSE